MVVLSGSISLFASEYTTPYPVSPYQSTFHSQSSPVALGETISMGSGLLNVRPSVLVEYMGSLPTSFLSTYTDPPMETSRRPSGVTESEGSRRS